MTIKKLVKNLLDDKKISHVRLEIFDIDPIDGFGIVFRRMVVNDKVIIGCLSVFGRDVLDNLMKKEIKEYKEKGMCEDFLFVEVKIKPPKVEEQVYEL